MDEYIDRAISGKTDNRPSFQQLIRDSEKGHFDAVIMYTLDRFARNRYDSAIYKAKLKKNGVKVFYAKQPMPDTPEGIILESVLEGYAEYYSENLARSIKRGLKENALHGIAMGSPCLGYKIGADRQYEIEPVGAKTVQTIFTMYAEGKSATQIVNWLNEQGCKTSRGNAFNKNSLKTILRNDKYIGVYRFDDVILEDAVPPIIDRKLFEKVQAMLQHNYSVRARTKSKEDYLLTTKLFCGHCGKPMVGESGTSHTGRMYYYYKCTGRKRGGKCPKAVEKKDWIEEIVVRFTVEKVLTDESIDRIATKAMEIIEKDRQDTSVLAGFQKLLKDCNKRIKNLLSAVEQGLVTPATKDRLEELEQERRDLEGQIVREEMKKPLLTKERIVYWLTSFKSGDIRDIEYQRRVIDTLVNSVFVYDDGDKGRKIVLTFNISGSNTLTITSSDIECLTPPERGSYSRKIVRASCIRKRSQRTDIRRKKGKEQRNEKEKSRAVSKRKSAKELPFFASRSHLKINISIRGEEDEVKKLDGSRRELAVSRNSIPVPGLPIPQPRIYLYWKRRELHENRGRGNKRAESEAEKPSEAEEGRIE